MAIDDEKKKSASLAIFDVAAGFLYENLISGCNFDVAFGRNLRWEFVWVNFWVGFYVVSF
jgi:hypothetical protein